MCKIEENNFNRRSRAVIRKRYANGCHKNNTDDLGWTSFYIVDNSSSNKKTLGCRIISVSRNLY